MLAEAEAGWPSVVSGDLNADAMLLDRAEIAERSGRRRGTLRGHGPVVFWDAAFNWLDSLLPN